MGTDVVLISMPWHRFNMVSLQLGALKAYLSSKGVDVRCYHAYKDVLAYIDRPLYDELLDANVCELISAALLFPDRRSQIQGVAIDQVRAFQIATHGRPAAEPLDFDLCVGAIDRLIDGVLADEDWERARLVGLTSTHVQFMPSVVFAKRLKERYPDLPIVFGGYLLRDELAEGLLELFPYVDYVVAGEGEIPLHRLVLALTGEGDVADVPSLVSRGADGSIRANNRTEVVADLDDLPVPDYSDYFERRGEALLSPHPQIQIEASRGCFWGRCVFCVESMRPHACYRRKSADRVVAEVEHLARQWRSLDFMFTDADVSDKVDVFAQIRELPLDLTFAAELTGFIDRDGLKTLREAGVKHVQIGVEAFDDRLLKIFAKGVRFIRYVQLMKWCKELDVNLFYNIILGAPFETQDDIDIAAERASSLRWFQYPAIAQFALSPGSQIAADPARYGITEIAPGPAARTCYPEDVCEKIPPLVEFGELSGYSFAPQSRADHAELLARIDRWTHEYAVQPPDLVLREGSDFLEIVVSGRAGEYHFTITDPLEQGVYRQCMESARHFAQIAAAFPDADEIDLRRILYRYETLGLMLSDGRRHLSLASWARERTPGREASSPVRHESVMPAST